MLSYQKPPIEGKTAAALLPVRTILPTSSTTTTTMDRGSSKWIGRMATSVAGILLLVAGGTVVQRDGNKIAAEGLVVATAANDDHCLPAVGGTFSGASTTTIDGETDHFQTCYQYGSASTYCWTKSYYADSWFQCVPDQPGGYTNGPWHSVDPQYVNPVTTPFSCGPPCKDVRKERSGFGPTDPCIYY